MKYTHRQAIGLELFFSGRSSTFSGLNECTMSDVEHLATGSSIFTRSAVAADIHSALNALMELDCCPRELIPDSVARLAERPVTECCKAASLRDFWGWLIELARRNETDRVARVSSLNTVASCFDSVTASFVRTAFALNNQRVVLTRQGDRLRAAFAEREWGRAEAEFSGCSFPEDFPEDFLPGYIFSTETRQTDDGRYEFLFLIDTSFSDGDYSLRLMQSNGWHELCFTCDAVSARIIACDYAGRLARLGTPRAELIDRVCSTLLSKKSILGSGGLSSSEQAMVPLASFITGCGGILTARKDQRWRSEQMILEALDNRYAMNQFQRLLDDSKSTELLNNFSSCTQARYDDNDSAALKNTRQYAGLYELHIADGRARPLIMELSDRLCEMTADLQGLTPRVEAEIDVTGKVLKAVEPQLSAMKFVGQYPHYSREKRCRTEYLSLMVLPASETSKRGVSSYYVSLAAAQIPAGRRRELESTGLEWSRTNALDCQPEQSTVSRYGELASADDGVFVRIDADLFGHTRTLVDDSDQLLQYIRLADHQFRKGRLPVGYSLRRMLGSVLPSPVLRMFFAALPLCAAFSLALLVGYLLLTQPLALPMLTPTQAFGGAAALCAVLCVAVTILRRVHHARRLWRFR